MKRSRAVVFFLIAGLFSCLTAFSLGFSVTDDLFRIMEYDNQPIRFTVHAKIIRVPQFSDERTEKLNRLLQHIGLEGSSDGCIQYTAVMIDGEETVRCTGKETEDGTILSFSADPEHLYRYDSGNVSDTAFKSDRIDTETIQRYRKIWTATDRMVSWFELLPEQFPEKSVRTAIQIRNRYYGTAVRRETITFSAEEAESVFMGKGKENDGFYPEYADLKFEGKQKIILQYTEDNQLIRIHYSGKCGQEPGNMRNVTLEWKLLRTADCAMDELQLRTPSEKGNERDNLLMKRERKKTENSEENLLWTVESDRLHNRIRTQTKLTATSETIGERTLLNILETKTERGQTGRTEITGEITAEHDTLKGGTLEIILKTGTIETIHWQVSFQIAKGERLSLENEGCEIIRMTGNEIPDELYTKIYAALIQKMISLPEEDLVFLTEGIEETIKETAR